MAELLIDEIRELAFDEKIDIIVWKVKKDKNYPHGLKYSFNYRVWNGIEWTEIIRYDNALSIHACPHRMKGILLIYPDLYSR